MMQAGLETKISLTGNVAGHIRQNLGRVTGFSGQLGGQNPYIVTKFSGFFSRSYQSLTVGAYQHIIRLFQSRIALFEGFRYVFRQDRPPARAARFSEKHRESCGVSMIFRASWKVVIS